MSCGDGYKWYPKPEWKSLTYVWMQLDNPPCEPHAGGCMYAADGLCVVYSKYTEQQARNRYTSGVSLFDHEVGPGSKDGVVSGAKFGHCAGYAHQQ